MWIIDPEFPQRVFNYEMTGNDWQLYASTMPEECAKAAKVLNDKLFECIAEKTDWKTVRDKMYKHMDEFIELGARDTEPEVVLCDCLTLFFPHDTDDISRW